MKKLIQLISVFYTVIQLYSISHTAQFPPGTQVEIMSDFSGGLNTASPPNKIDKSFSPGEVNIFVHRQPGKLIKRNGFLQAGIATNTLTSISFMTVFYKENGTKEFIVSDDSIVLTTQDFFTYIVISTALNQSAHLQSKQIRNKIWFTNGTDSIFTWDGIVKQTLDGTNGTPNVPKFKFIEQYQERVFGLNSTNNGSSLYWSDVASTAGVAISPDSYLAWPAGNSLPVGQGDGEVGTALWNYGGQLQIGKERSIYTLYGTNTSNYNARRTESWIGPSSQDSIVILDDLTYFKSYNGIYAYDGGKVTRISDDISPDVDAMRDVQIKQAVNIWDTKALFDTGNFYDSVLSTTNVIKEFVGRRVDAWHTSQKIPDYLVGNFDPSTTYFYTVLDLASAINAPVSSASNDWLINENQVYVDRITVGMGGSAGVPTRLRATLTNKFTGVQQTTVTTAVPGTTTFYFSSHSFTFDGTALTRSSISLNVEWENYLTDPLSQGFQLIAPDNGPAWQIYFIGKSTGQYVSQIATNTIVTAWQTFEADQNTNGGSIKYYIRSATSVVTMSTQAWQPISPGVLIPFSNINTFIQWASTLTAIANLSAEPQINSVVINHIEGPSSRDRPFAIGWSKEYWLSVSTETTGTLSAQYVKSWITNRNPNAWMLMNGMNIRSFMADGNNSLYGGGASTSAVYRLDYGTNDNGSAIDGYYETPDLTLKGALTGGYDGNWLEEQISELWGDVDSENGNIFRLGLSLNGGAYKEQTRDVSGTGRNLFTLYNQSNFAKYFRLRFRNNQMDKGLGVNNIAVIYSPLLTR